MADCLFLLRHGTRKKKRNKNINVNVVAVGGDVDSDVSLNDYIRERLNLRGTKYMCKEGGCGACIVAVSTADDTGPRAFSVNSVSPRPLSEVVG